MTELWLAIGVPVGLFLFGIVAVTLAGNRLDALRALAEMEESDADDQ